MAQTLYWVVVPAADAAYANNDTDAAKIVAGNRVGGTAATASGSEAAPGSTATVDESTPATGLTSGTSYRIAWTIYDGSAYGGGTATKVVESAAFTAASTGTVAYTNAADTSAASGTTTVTGTVARTNAADTSAASGTTTVVGTLARTNAADTSVASGSAGSDVTGTSATTNANDTSAASGTTTVTGTSATTNAADTSTAAGTTTVTGTSAATNAADTATASGVAGVVSGTAAVTNANDSSSASGDAGAPETTARRGGAWKGTGWQKARQRIALQTWWDYLTEEDPAESTKRIIAEVKAGRPIPQTKPPKGPASISAEKLAEKIIPSRLWAAENILVEHVELQRVVAKAIRIAQERDDEEILMLL